jgi:hypothetical protein
MAGGVVMNYAYVDYKGNIIEVVENLTEKPEITTKLQYRGVAYILEAPVGFNNPRWSPREEEWYENNTLVGNDLEYYKNRKMDMIDEKTHEILNKGFEFDNNTFSLSQNAQLNWTGLQTAVNSGLLIESDFPYPITTAGDIIYDLSWANLTAFTGTVLQTVQNELHAGRMLKKQIADAVTKEEVDAVVDGRA